MRHYLPQHFRVDLAVADLLGGLANWRVWIQLGWLEVKKRYRRTMLGPLWLTLSMGILTTALGVVWARLFHMEISEYLPFVATGIVSWGYVAALINEGTGVYTGAAGLIKELKFPLSTLNYMIIWRNIIVHLHNMVIVVVVVALFPVPVTWATLLVVPGILIVAINGLWASIILGLISTRFRDVPPLVSNVMQVLIFITPIFWSADRLGAGSKIVLFNYLYHLTDMIRSPLLGKAPALTSYGIAMFGTVVGGVISLALYARFRQRVAYWL